MKIPPLLTRSLQGDVILTYKPGTFESFNLLFIHFRTKIPEVLKHLIPPGVKTFPCFEELSKSEALNRYTLFVEISLQIRFLEDNSKKFLYFLLTPTTLGRRLGAIFVMMQPV